MKNLLGARFVMLGLVFLMVGCGSSEEVTSNRDAQTRTGFDPVSFSCESHSCNSKDEYCLKSVSGDLVLTSECTKLPENCGKCGCAVEDAREIFKDVDNCKYSVGCTQDDSVIHVTCGILGS